jgi:hypothetical protein
MSAYRMTGLQYHYLFEGSSLCSKHSFANGSVDAMSCMQATPVGKL